MDALPGRRRHSKVGVKEACPTKETVVEKPLGCSSEVRLNRERGRTQVLLVIEHISIEDINKETEERRVIRHSRNSHFSSGKENIRVTDRVSSVHQYKQLIYYFS